MEMADFMQWYTKKVGKPRYTVAKELKEMDISVSNSEALKYSPDPEEGSQGIRFKALAGLWVIARNKGVKAEEFLEKIVELFLSKEYKRK